jgi:prepilin-type N-terminal cleavage/methylation domain-containing protein
MKLHLPNLKRNDAESRRFGCPNASIRHSRRGVSLLEVILSIAILGTAMVAITQLLNIGYTSALSSRLRTSAALHCDTKIAEIAAGAIELVSSNGQQIQEDPEWIYSVDVSPGAQMGLLVVTVTVSQADSALPAPISISVVRFMPDPDYDPAEEEGT